MSLYVLCGVVLAIGFVLAWRLKRDAEASWARHQAMVRAAEQRAQMARLTKAMLVVRIVAVDRLTPALRKVGVEMGRLARHIESFGSEDDL